ncbi:type III secretory pathway component EscS [Scopulibacillus daqui]|uniref:Type III secretory pathway component EscS n=1 Tax=Scopulibacillus daqui TaxID=1469162 RepID=A0ABS2PWW6_9BACL|nr:DUF2642 domain-containing protein [Scopulibacillus daqui]MBM7644426.1 type III secretory pathway component EscS [Scopulibacillus daqui]
MESKFKREANNLVGSRVKVVTTIGAVTGILESVGDDFLVLRVRIRNRTFRFIIRLALIVALLRVLTDGCYEEVYSYEENNTFDQEDERLENF